MNNPFYEFTAQILCPTGTLLSMAPKDTYSWYLNGLNKAGKEIMLHGKISPETQTILDRELAGPDDLARMSEVTGINFSG